MPGQWYYSYGNQQLGPVTQEELRGLIERRVVQPADLVWADGMPEWKPALSVPSLFPDGVPGGSPPPVPVKDQNVANTKLAAGICGIAVGSFGVHKFVLGMNNPGVIMLVVSLATCGIGAIVMHVIGIVEGIKYLLMTDEEFQATYMIGKKEWF